jgi:hypothetical protein
MLVHQRVYNLPKIGFVHRYKHRWHTKTDKTDKRNGRHPSESAHRSQRGFVLRNRKTFWNRSDQRQPNSTYVTYKYAIYSEANHN